MRTNFILALIGIEIGEIGLGYTSYVIMMYGAGTIAEPILGTILIDFNKENGYWIFTAGFCFYFFFLSKYNKKKISY